MRAIIVTRIGLLGVLACAPSRPEITPNIDPGSTDAPAMPIPPEAVVTDHAPSLPPEEAFRRGLMPLASTGIPDFLRAFPNHDGRGVLIAILDSGLDPGVPGLLKTTDGRPKVVDVRDFSGEGGVKLTPVEPEGDTIVVGGQVLTGFGRVRSFNLEGPWYAGAIAELSLGRPPASDLNGNGGITDTLAVVVTQATDDWVVFADTDGDGSLADSRPVRDYLAGGETFGWHVEGASPPITIAVNLKDGEDGPQLDLVFDNSGHGTHVAGIAAGHDMYGVAGFNGVAPGAQLLGLKIANDAHGGLSTTGSMLRAADYAIEFAAASGQPLVINMSFGVGNEIEGTARIDMIVDSILAVHPELVWVISAGNEGPGLSTIGFPGSATRALTVGATMPAAFLQGGAALPGEPIAYFSGRGGELAKPEIVTPGVAYSTVPAWDVGQEQASGTSMAAPYASGLVALLQSGILQEGLEADANEIRRALMVTARPVRGETFLDQGSGLPDIGAAWQWISESHPVSYIRVHPAGDSTTGAAFRQAGLRGPGDTTQIFDIRRPMGLAPATFRMASSAAWLSAPPSVTLSDTVTRIALIYSPEALNLPGVYTGTVSGWGSDSAAGPAFRLVNTVIVPAADSMKMGPLPITSGGQRRFFFPVDSGRPFSAIARSGENGHQILVFLHEPGGMPVIGGTPLAVPFGQDAIFHVGGRDATGGIWQMVAVAPPTRPSSAGFQVLLSPVRINASRDQESVQVRLEESERPFEGEVSLDLVGAARSVRVVASGSARQDISFTLPSWAQEIEVDVEMDREQWSRFTDFGVTLFDDTGRLLENAPLNYAEGRMTFTAAEGHGDMPLRLSLFPAFADRSVDSSWTANVTIRVYADELHPLVADGGSAVSMKKGESLSRRFTMPEVPWKLGDGFYPLGMVVLKSNESSWMRQVGLPASSPPLMK